MRIRKHASKIVGSAASFAWLSSSPPLEDLLVVSALGDVCELNRSPWDVVLPSPASTADGDHAKHEVECEESTGNWIPREEAISVSPDSKRGLAKAEPDDKKDNETKAVVKECCKKNDGRGWRCKKPAQLPHALCEYHVGRGRGCNLAHNPPTAAAPICCSSHHRNHPDKKKTRTKKAAAKADAVGDFYYYSEFGPWRRKRRSGDGVGVGGADVSGMAGREDHLKSDHCFGVKPSDGEGEGENLDDCAGIDGHDDTLEEQGDGDGWCDWKDVGDKRANGKKRGRKRIKARSLSSLL